MANIIQTLDRIVQHRELVPVYYHRPTRSFIVTGLSKTAGGAVVVAIDGSLVDTFASKRDALFELNHK